MAHFVQYHPRIVTGPRRAAPQDLWYARDQAPTAGFTTPQYHTTRAASGAAARVRPGDTIWLISQLRARGHPAGPLALDARLTVRAVRTHPEPRAGDWHFQYDAGPGSCWFPLFDIGDTLTALQSRTTAGPGTRPFLRPGAANPGQAMRQLREIVDAGPLEDLAARIAAAPLHFVSYRLKDGTWHAFAQVRALSHEPVAIWWDRWSLPRRLAERREVVSDIQLDRAIEQAIDRACVVWGIETETYRAPDSYALRERERAIVRGTYRGIPMKEPLS